MREDSKQPLIEEETKEFDQRFNTGKNRMFEFNSGANPEYPAMTIKEVASKESQFSRRPPPADKFNYRIEGDSIKETRPVGKSSL